jgi:hypothetical protein
MEASTYGPKPSLHFYLKSFRPLPRPTELTQQVGTDLECEVAAVDPRSFHAWYLPCLLFVQGLDSIRVRSQFPIFYPSFQINILSLTALRLTIAPGQQLTNRLDVILWIWSLSILPGREPGRLAGTCIPFPGSANCRSATLPYSTADQQCSAVQQRSPVLYSASLRRYPSSPRSACRPYYPVSYRTVLYHTAQDGNCNHP